jgi:hypothetical protein
MTDEKNVEEIGMATKKHMDAAMDKKLIKKEIKKAVVKDKKEDAKMMKKKGCK